MNKKTKHLFLTIISLLSLSIILHKACYANNTNAVHETTIEKDKFNLPRILSISGNGKESIPTSLSNINLSIEINANTANNAQKEVAKRANIVVEYLRSQKVDKLKTTNINLSPRYEYETNKPQKLIGYTANNGISFQTSHDKAGAILDEAIRLGATRIDGISFSADSLTIQKAKNLAIEKAIQDAKQKAGATLSVLNFSIKDIINIKVDNAEPITIQAPRVMMERSMAKASYAADSSPIIGGDEEVEANVNLNIAY